MMKSKYSQALARVLPLALLLPALATLGACQTTDDAPASSQMPFAGLEGTRWRLVEFQSMDDAQGTTRPNDRDKYTITFNNDGTLSAQIDCNRGVGPWRNDISNATGGSLEIGPLAVTRAFCPEPSMGTMLEQQLGYVRSFTITANRLNMALMADGGIIVWEPKAY